MSDITDTARFHRAVSVLIDELAVISELSIEYS